VEQVAGLLARPDRAEAPGLEEVGETVIDRHEALQRVEGMTELLKEMAELFLEEYSDLHDRIAAKLQAGELEIPRELSHRIKGTVGLFAAHGPFEAAKRMNDLAKAEDFEGTVEAWSHLDEQMQQLLPELEVLASEGIAAWA